LQCHSCEEALEDDFPGIFQDFFGDGGIIDGFGIFVEETDEDDDV